MPKLCLFPLSVSSTAITWFTSLPPRSIYFWPQIEQKFHEYFYTGETKPGSYAELVMAGTVNSSKAMIVGRNGAAIGRCDDGCRPHHHFFPRGDRGGAVEKDKIGPQP